MVATKKNLLIASAGVAIAFNFSACKKDKDSQTDKLVGEWKFVTITGYPVEQEDYLITFEFQKDKDFKYCYEEIGAQKYCYFGDWEWSNDNETEVDFTIEDETIVLKIETLTDNLLEGDLVIDENVAEVTMKKID